MVGVFDAIVSIVWMWQEKHLMCHSAGSRVTLLYFRSLCTTVGAAHASHSSFEGGTTKISPITSKPITSVAAR